MYIGNIKRHDLSRFPKLVSLSLSLTHKYPVWIVINVRITTSYILNLSHLFAIRWHKRLA